MGSQKSSGSVLIQERDVAILRDLYESRVMTTEHIASIHFGGKYEAAKKRLQILKSAKLIKERPRKKFNPAVLGLAKAGLALLGTRGILLEYPDLGPSALIKRTEVASSALPHELEVVNVKATLCTALARTPCGTIVEFTTWPLLNQFLVSGQLIKPDGFIRVQATDEAGVKSEYSFFLELDRSTEPLRTLAFNASCYAEYFKSGGFAYVKGAGRAALRTYPFRALYILKTAERRNNTIDRLLQQHPPILTLVWLTTLAEFERDPLGAIWIRPVDYRDATAGTPFASVHRRSEYAYRRQTAREVFVDKNVIRHRLL